jgi:hypothetical protein
MLRSRLVSLVTIAALAAFSFRLGGQTPAAAPPCPAASVLLTAQPIYGVGVKTIAASCPAFQRAIASWYASDSATISRWTAAQIIAAITTGARPTVPAPTPAPTPVPAPAPAPIGTTEPTPAGTILFDMRAGGRQSLQAAADIATVRALFNSTGGELTDGDGHWRLATNVDGSGKKALAVDWPANPGRESSAIGILYYGAEYDRVYTTVTIHLGRTATGGGLGTIGSFVPVTSGGGMKRLLWLRHRDDGTDRVYWVWPTQPAGGAGHNLSIDNRNYDVGFSADFGVGQDVRWTFELIAGEPGHLRVWRNGVLVLDNQRAAIGSLPFSELELMATRFNTTQAETEYWTDLVVWRP